MLKVPIIDSSGAGVGLISGKGNKVEVAVSVGGEGTEGVGKTVDVGLDANVAVLEGVRISKVSEGTSTVSEMGTEVCGLATLQADNDIHNIRGDKCTRILNFFT